jgi:hypothetical protein
MGGAPDPPLERNVTIGLAQPRSAQMSTTAPSVPEESAHRRIGDVNVTAAVESGARRRGARSAAAGMHVPPTSVLPALQAHEAVAWAPLGGDMTHDWLAMHATVAPHTEQPRVPRVHVETPPASQMDAPMEQAFVQEVPVSASDTASRGVAESTTSIASSGTFAPATGFSGPSESRSRLVRAPHAANHPATRTKKAKPGPERPIGRLFIELAWLIVTRS